MKKILGFMLALVICLGAFMIIAPNIVKADDNIASGTSGTCSWVIDADGVLTISPTDGVSGTLDSYRYVYDSSGYGNSPSAREIGIPWVDYMSSVTKVVISPGVKAGNGCDALFQNMSNCTEIVGLSNLDTSDTISTAGMFQGCSSLSTIDLSSLDLSHVTIAEHMFSRCSSLTELDVTGFTGDLTYLNGMFLNCSRLTYLDLSTWNTSNARPRTYYGTGRPQSGTLRPFTSSGLRKVTLGDSFYLVLNTPDSSVSTGRWVSEDGTYGPYTPTGLPSAFVADMAGDWVWELAPCAVLCEDNTLYFVRPSEIGDLVGGVGTITSISGGEYTGRVFKVDEITVNTGINPPAPSWSSIASQVNKVVFVDKIKPKMTDKWFSGFTACTEMDLANLDTSLTTSMTEMFKDCSSVVELDLSHFDTSKVTTTHTSVSTGMIYMFDGCSSLRSLNLSNWDTSHVTSMMYMFRNCSSLESLDVSHFDTSNVKTIMYMFAGCSSLKTLDVSNFDVTKMSTLSRVFQDCSSLESINVSNLCKSNITSLYYTFSGCSSLKTLDLSTWDTSNVTDMSYLVNNCSSLESLDISNFDTSRTTYLNSMFSKDVALRSVKIGENFKFHGSNAYYVGRAALLPTPSSEVPYTGKWIREDEAYGPYTAADLRDNYTSDMAGTWVWEERDPNGYVVFDANGGGFTTADIKITFLASEGVHPFTTLGEEVTEYPGHFLMGWSEDQNATEPTYDADSEINIGELEKTKILYAVWTADGITRYHVKHFQQSYDLSGYTLAETECLYGEAGAEVMPAVKTYENFDSPEPITVTLNVDGSTEVTYEYDRLQYRIHFDGNGATAGSMSDMHMLIGVGGQLRSNAFRKTGAIFTGWNTAEDGSGTTYTDKANVIDLTSTHKETVTLYAQWLENENPAMEPTNGAVRVTLKQGQTVVIPDLPAGTSYTIREVSNPSGWEWKSTDGETGTITANQTNDATVHNVYHAVGSIPFEIYKVLEDGLSGENKPIEAGKFTFALVDASNMRIMVASNEATDTDETIFNAAGEEVSNPNYGKALVSFDTIEYDESDIGKTYTYYISEINTPEGYEASEPVTVTVTIADAGQGQLDVTASYDHNQMITNTDRTGGFLEVKKFVSGSAPEGAEFTFKVDLSDESGKTYAESVAGVKSDDSTLNITSGETFTLKADESATFRLPAGITYKVSEQIGDGWTLVQSSGTAGSINSGQTSTAIFTNAYNVEGIVEIPATKTLTGKELTANEFNFVLEDADGNVVAQATNDATGNIIFKVPYTTEDVGQTYTYTAHEVIPDETFGVTYDETIYTVQVAVSAENGTLTGSVTIVDHDSMVWNNTYAASTDITVSGKKVLTGRDFRDTDKWTFTLDGDGPKPQDVSIEIYPAQGDSFSFTIPFSTADMEGQRTKEFTYTVTESGFVPLVANDKSAKTFTVRVTDDGEGVMKAELLNADDLDLTFTNRALVTLPMTGSMASIWIMLAGLLVIAAGIMYSRKRRNDLAE